MSHIAAYRTGWDSPSGRVGLHVVGLSGLGKPYTGLNDKYADTYVYERTSLSNAFHRVWHAKIPLHNIGDMEVECEWTGDQVARLTFYDYGAWDSFASKSPRPQRRFVTAIRLERTKDGSWHHQAEVDNKTVP